MLERRTRERWRFLLVMIMMMMVKVISNTERNVNVVNGKVLCLATESGRHIYTLAKDGDYMLIPSIGSIKRRP